MDRTNKITGRKYVDEPTIMAWELANEPRPMRPGANERYVEWIRRVAAEIKARDKNHLVTIGHEGSVGTEGMELFEEIHRNPNIDYLTIHIWPKNWGWLAKGFPVAVGKTVEYIDQHIAVARRLKKPLVIEEFGLPRDEKKLSPQRRGDAERSTSKPETEHALAYRYTAFGLASQCLPLRLCDSAVSYPPQERHVLSLEPGSPTKLRDEYFRKIFSYLGSGVAGANFWAFGGTARPVKGQIFWKPGDEYMGDPPMEEQGLNTVFDVDRSTWAVIRAASRSIRNKN
jgi:mannan endo-1,4-beta-mannosidase